MLFVGACGAGLLLNGFFPDAPLSSSQDGPGGSSTGLDPDLRQAPKVRGPHTTELPDSHMPLRMWHCGDKLCHTISTETATLYRPKSGSWEQGLSSGCRLSDRFAGTGDIHDYRRNARGLRLPAGKPVRVHQLEALPRGGPCVHHASAAAYRDPAAAQVHDRRVPPPHKIAPSSWQVPSTALIARAPSLRASSVGARNTPSRVALSADDSAR